MPATYEPIATTTLGSAAGSITFSSIGSSYTDLKLIIVGTTTSNASVYLNFNNDTTALYSQTHLAANGSAVMSGRTTGQTKIISPPNYSFFNSVPSMIICDIFSYAGATNKTSIVSAYLDKNGSGAVEIAVGLYRSTTAISRIDLTPQAGNFNTGTTTTLYGIKNA
jgi:hypothetical protein